MIDWVKLAGFIVGRIKARAAAYRRVGDRYEDSQMRLQDAAIQMGAQAAEARREGARLQRVAQKLEGILK